MTPLTRTNSALTNPVIFIGMHRSGTSLLGRLLEQLGLFVGDQKDPNNEALFFLELNIWLMNQCGARWDQPEPMKKFWSRSASPVLDASVQFVQDLVFSPRSAKFLGITRFLQSRSLYDIQYPWGWKDPRNTYTLPFWLKLFPDARIVFIDRHGVDVAESLRVRANRSIKEAGRRYQKAKSFAWLRPKRSGFCESVRCLSLEGGFSLWESYQWQAKQHLSEISKERVFCVRYEELLKKPQQILTNTASFCGLTTTPEQVREITDSVNQDRAFSFEKDPVLVNFANSRVERLKAWGY